MRCILDLDTICRLLKSPQATDISEGMLQL
jgi:hypothetical protein